MAAGSAAVLTAFVLNFVIFLLVFTAFSFLRVRDWGKRFFAPRSEPISRPLSKTRSSGGGRGSSGGGHKAQRVSRGTTSRLSAITAAADPSETGPLHAATGGLLVQQRVGPTNEELLRELEEARPDDVHLSEGAAEVNRRTTKRYNYNLWDEGLHSLHQARQGLESGLTPQQLVAREFATVYGPANVAAVNMIQDTAALEPLANEYNALLEKLEDYLDLAQLRLKLRKPLPHKQVRVLGALYGEWGKEQLGTKWFKKVDALDFWLKRLRHLRERMVEARLEAECRTAPSAFVTFNTRMAQAVGASSMHHHDVKCWRVANAPAPPELVWKNLGMTLPLKSSRRYLLWVVFWLMALFFMIPIAAVQAMIEVPKLANLPVLGKIVKAPAVRQLLEAIVPGVVLKLFLVVVPVILRFMSLLAGATSRTAVDLEITKRYFLFQVIVVFFGNIIAGSFFNQAPSGEGTA
ncbi:putative membrane protein C2G11.09 [Tetrabaena socialis]|uniref:Putative membrane protein C2G11.09 n=1 Tax=Tetrabaena socialis TaxID=47790 RepID=A0A2J7ZQ39_9CHLO|nr:putative membrane protein C2G11.09 [Tetrabaena socialis]|eukprot:PNH02372.1 putative membrane protein C2G11.09 [Tetrabaena socialis]